MSVIEKLSSKMRVAILFAAMAALCPVRARANQPGNRNDSRQRRRFHDGRDQFDLRRRGKSISIQPVGGETKFRAGASIGPNPKIPYFTVRFAMPIPPENETNNFAALTGIDPNGVHAQPFAGF